MRRTIIAIILLALFLLFLFFSPSYPFIWAYPTAQFAAATTLRGDMPYSEIAQDTYGFRAMISGQNAYLPLYQALSSLDIDWYQPTTHPPTAFLLAAPVAFFPFNISAAVWAWLMLTATFVSLRLYGQAWSTALWITILSILWLPTIGSLGQLTPVWLLGVSLAYRFRNRRPFLAGIFIALASFTKFFPALLLIPFALKRKWKAVLGFVLLWLLAVCAIWLISPQIFTQYYEMMQTTSAKVIARPDNAALLIFAFRLSGISGLGLALGLLLLIPALNWRQYFIDKEIDLLTWDITAYLAVALLPIAWGYSFFPLLPGLIRMANENKPTRIFGILAIIFFSSICPLGTLLYGFGLLWKVIDPTRFITKPKSPR